MKIRAKFLFSVLCGGLFVVIFVELYISSMAKSPRRQTSRKSSIKKFFPRTISPPIQTHAVHNYFKVKNHYGKLQHLYERINNVPLGVSATANCVAIGCAITSRGLESTDYHAIGQIFPFFRTFLPSLCKTASAGFDYHIYIAYDHTDVFLAKGHSHRLFMEKFKEITTALCPNPRLFNISVHFVQCSHVAHPAWAQNDAMMEAYLDGNTYFFRINDDTSLSTPGWTEQFINALHSFKPPNVGVVGPAHKGGNEYILTHDFVHKTHIDIFGSYYPRLFGDWWADDWISYVYQPNHMLRLDHVKAIHTSEKGTRYNHTQIDSINVVQAQVDSDRNVLNRYIQGMESSHSGEHQKLSLVISMSLYGTEEKYTYGALRNAQLAKLVFPDWTMRMYIEKPNTNNTFKYGQVPQSFISKMESLKVKFEYVDTENVKMPPMFWRFLVADDDSVDAFIVRDSDSRLSERDYAAVSAWLNSSKAFHCMRDHPSHTADPVYGGLWGGKPKDLNRIINIPFHMLMKGYHQDYAQDIFFLGNAVWPRVKHDAMCHDSIACQKYPGSLPFPTQRNGQEHVGQVFDAYGVPRQIDLDIINYSDLRAFCEDHPKAGDVRGRAANVDYELPDGPTQAAIPKVKAPRWFKKLKVFSIALDHRPVEDIKDLLSPLGVQFVDYNLNSTFKGSHLQSDLKVINETNVMHLSKETVDKFFQVYKDDALMKTVTHFLCAIPPSLCELYMKFNQSKFLIVTSRYEKGLSRKEDQSYLDRLLYTLSWNQQNLIASNNYYDKEYIRYYTGLHFDYVPSYCGYVNTTYSSTIDYFLVILSSSATHNAWFVKSLNETVSLGRQAVKLHFTSDPSGLSYNAISSYRGIVYVPTDVSQMMFCEHYRMNIPLFFPSLNLLVKWHQDYNILSQRTVHKGEPLENIPGPGHRYNPNEETEQSGLKYWLRYADFYKWPYLVHYDSVEDLALQLQITNLPATSFNMKTFNAKLRADISNQWIDILKKHSKL